MMDIVFALLKTLSTTFSALEILLLVVLIVVAILMTAKYVAKSSNGKIISLIFGRSKEESLEASIVDLGKKIDLLAQSTATRLDVSGSNADLKTLLQVGLSELINGAKDEAENIDSMLDSSKAFRSDFTNGLDSIKRQLEDLSHATRMHDIHSEAQFAGIKETLQRSSDAIARLIAAVEKVDEFIKTASPEIRAQFKDLSKEVSALSKDIGIMDRLLQAQINNTGITLR